VSAPLARAGISIFYLSTYQTDYVLIKERRLWQVVRTLQECGFTFIDLDQVEVPTGSPVSPLSDTPRFLTNSDPFSGDESEMDQASNATLTQKVDTQARVLADMRSRCPKTVLSHHLSLVGLNRDYKDAWALRIMQLLFYPELYQHAGQSRRFVSYTLTSDGVSLVTDSNVLADFDEHLLNRSQTPTTLRLVQIQLSSLGYGGLQRTVSVPKEEGTHMSCSMCGGMYRFISVANLCVFYLMVHLIHLKTVMALFIPCRKHYFVIILIFSILAHIVQQTSL
jgi:hypothetical protein